MRKYIIQYTLSIYTSQEKFIYGTIFSTFRILIYHLLKKGINNNNNNNNNNNKKES